MQESSKAAISQRCNLEEAKKQLHAESQPALIRPERSSKRSPNVLSSASVILYGVLLQILNTQAFEWRSTIESHSTFKKPFLSLVY